MRLLFEDDDDGDEVEGDGDDFEGDDDDDDDESNVKGKSSNDRMTKKEEDKPLSVALGSASSSSSSSMFDGGVASSSRTWKCDGCMVLNDWEVSRCPCCNTMSAHGKEMTKTLSLTKVEQPLNDSGQSYWVPSPDRPFY
jgi:hypothetical protein